MRWSLGFIIKWKTLGDFPHESHTFIWMLLLFLALDLTDLGNFLTAKGIQVHNHPTMPWSNLKESLFHYNDVIMDAVASQITSLTIVCSTVYYIKMTTSSAATDENFIKITTFPFQWMSAQWSDSLGRHLSLFNDPDMLYMPLFTYSVLVLLCFARYYFVSVIFVNFALVALGLMHHCSNASDESLKNIGK